MRKSTKSSKIFLTKSSKAVAPSNAELASEIEELKAVIDALLDRIELLEGHEADDAKAGNLFDVTFLHINARLPIDHAAIEPNLLWFSQTFPIAELRFEPRDSRRS